MVRLLLSHDWRRGHAVQHVHSSLPSPRCICLLFTFSLSPASANPSPHSTAEPSRPLLVSSPFFLSVCPSCPPVFFFFFVNSAFLMHFSLHMSAACRMCGSCGLVLPLCQRRPPCCRPLLPMCHFFSLLLYVMSNKTQKWKIDGLQALLFPQNTNVTFYCC